MDNSETLQAPPQFNFFSKYGGVKENDASLELFISTDDMFLIGKFQPPKDGGKMLVADEIEASLMTLGIAHGIQYRTLAEGVFQCNMNHKVLGDIILARGTQPKKERPAFLKLEPRLFAGAYPQQQTLSNVDMKSFSKITIVKKGELLARGIKSQEGQNGFTIKGDPIPFGKKDIKFLKPGVHTIYAHGKVFARTAGRFVVDRDTFDISSHLEVEGDVDYGVGHINFPGDVTITGRVMEGFHVICGKDLILKGPLDASMVLVKNNLSCGGGLFGNGPALVRTGGSVRVQFIENCHLEALGPVHAGKEILNAEVYTNGSLDFADGGKIVNSTVWAQGPVHVSRIGNDTTRSFITVGVDFVIHRKVEHMKEEYRNLEEEAAKIRDRMRDSRSNEGDGVLKEIQVRLDNLIQEINSHQAKMIQPEKGVLSVKGELWPGTIIEMGYARLEINEVQAARTYRLSGDGRTILTEKYQPPEPETGESETQTQ